MSEFDDFDFIDSYGEAVEVKHENQLPDTQSFHESTAMQLAIKHPVTADTSPTSGY